MEKRKIPCIIENNLFNKIHKTHSAVEANTEWCGILIYKLSHPITSLKSLEDLKIICMDFMLLNIGSSAYTEATLTGEIVNELYDTYPDLIDKMETVKWGMIHTHHNMAAFFSGEDIDELKVNTKNHLFYLSLIVNYNGRWVAKLSFNIKTYIKIGEDNYEEVDSDPPFKAYDLSVQQLVDSNFVSHVNKLAQQKKLQQEAEALERQYNLKFNQQGDYKHNNKYLKVAKEEEIEEIDINITRKDFLDFIIELMEEEYKTTISKNVDLDDLLKFINLTHKNSKKRFNATTKKRIDNKIIQFVDKLKIDEETFLEEVSEMIVDIEEESKYLDYVFNHIDNKIMAYV